MASGSSPSGVDDTAARLLVTPIVGVAVPNLAGMVHHSSHSTAGLLATYAWVQLRRKVEDRQPMVALLAAALLLSLVLLPFRAWQAAAFTAPYRHADAAISRIDADVVLIDAPRHIYAVDLVRNDPFLDNQPKRMNPHMLTDTQLETLCRTYRVAIFKDADAGRFGLPVPGDRTEPARALPAACRQPR